MSASTAVDSMVSSLSRRQKLELFGQLSRDLDRSIPGIQKTVDVCGGAACIRRTRIPVWLLVGMRDLGASDETLLSAYPGLSKNDLENAWSFEAAFPDEIRASIAENEAD